MATGKTNAPFCLGFIAILGLTCALGCHHDAHGIQTGPTERILPPPNAIGFQGPAAPQPPVQAAVEVKQVSLEQAQPPAELPSPPQAVAAPRQDRESGSEFRQTLDLPGAIATAFRIQPKLRVALERIQQARERRYRLFGFPAAFDRRLLGGKLRPERGRAGHPCRRDSLYLPVSWRHPTGRPERTARLHVGRNATSVAQDPLRLGQIVHLDDRQHPGFCPPGCGRRVEGAIRIIDVQVVGGQPLADFQTPPSDWGPRPGERRRLRRACSICPGLSRPPATPPARNGPSPGRRNPSPTGPQTYLFLRQGPQHRCEPAGLVHQGN